VSKPRGRPETVIVSHLPNIYRSVQNNNGVT
jgi:hypothetical protein